MGLLTVARIGGGLMHYDYMQSQQLAQRDPSFAALIMAALRKADTENAAKLRAAFPEIYDEMHARYHAPGGILTSDHVVSI